MRRTSIFLVPALVDAAICANQSQPEGVVKVGIMKLEIVWRNPVQVTRVERKLQKVSSDEFGAVYSVTNPELIQEFELIQGAA